MFDDQIVEVVYNDYVMVTLKGIEDVYNILDSVTEDKKIAKLLIIGKGTQITEEARLGIIEANKLRKDMIHAEAIVVNSIAQKISANLYMKFIHQEYPIQCFTDIEKAIAWLSKHISKSLTA